MVNGYSIPDSMRTMQTRVRAEVDTFLKQHRPEQCVLVLDSTGPTATRHYVTLNAIGRERLLRFKEIHAFSGGAFGIFGFFGLTSNNAKLSFPELRAAHTERAFRSYHHKGALSVPKALYNLARRKSVFASNGPLYAMLEHIFKPEYAYQPFANFPRNVILHLGRKQTPSIVQLSNGAVCDAECMPLRERRLIDMIVAAVTVPIVYGNKHGQDEWFDPVYAGGYGTALRKASNTGAPTLVSTPWKSGRQDQVHFVNCFPTKRQKLAMLNDFARLVLNLPNHKWGHDIYAAFES